MCAPVPVTCICGMGAVLGFYLTLLMAVWGIHERTRTMNFSGNLTYFTCPEKKKKAVFH